MKVTYSGPASALELPGEVVVAAGETVEVDDVLGAELAQRDDWEAVGGKSPKSAKATDDAEEAQS